MNEDAMPISTRHTVAGGQSVAGHGLEMPLASSLELVKLTAYADPLPG
jgi:hypothetical protein